MNLDAYYSSIGPNVFWTIVASADVVGPHSLTSAPLHVFCANISAPSIEAQDELEIFLIESRPNSAS
jgi:hypothetical protein